jgi:hypothetical protein
MKASKAALLLAANRFEHRLDPNYGENLFELSGSRASPVQVV